MGYGEPTANRSQVRRQLCSARGAVECNEARVFDQPNPDYDGKSAYMWTGLGARMLHMLPMMMDATLANRTFLIADARPLEAGQSESLLPQVHEHYYKWAYTSRSSCPWQGHTCAPSCLPSAFPSALKGEPFARRRLPQLP